MTWGWEEEVAQISPQTMPTMSPGIRHHPTTCHSHLWCGASESGMTQMVSPLSSWFLYLPRRGPLLKMCKHGFMQSFACGSSTLYTNICLTEWILSLSFASDTPISSSLPPVCVHLSTRWTSSDSFYFVFTLGWRLSFSLGSRFPVGMQSGINRC